MTARLYGDRRAAVHMDVTLMAAKHDGRPGGCIHAGMIVAVGDRPYIRDLRTNTVDVPDGDVPPWNFVETTTAADVEAMPVGSWTWPVALGPELTRPG
ncbi:MAG: hypothetical protein EKK55_07105 [Rhodocyclaceae bacterium]|nr:MAG: hypothetical protein EKK55_07105 [Rhodocyclaceae bacterium]